MIISQNQANEFFRRGNDMGSGYAPEYGATVEAAVMRYRYAYGDQTSTQEPAK